MPKPLLPPRGVFTPSGILYDKALAPAVRDTWSQLRGLAWGGQETPPLSIRQLSEILEKSQSTIYEHMRLLRLRGALRWRSAGNSEIRVSFPEDRDLSENLEMLDPLLSTDKPISKRKRSKEGNNSENPESRKMPREILTEFVSTLAGVYLVDEKINYGRLAAEAKKLHEAGYPPQQVQELYFPCKNGLRSAWYQHDWRGQKGQVPQMGQVSQTIALLINPPDEIALDKRKKPKRETDFRRYQVPGEEEEDV